MEPLVRAVPGSRLVHDQDDFVRLRIVREKINHAGVHRMFGVQVQNVHRSSQNVQRPMSRLDSVSPYHKIAEMKAKAALIAAIFFGAITASRAQFTPAFLQNDSYWANGKAEFDIYDAQIVREGQPRPCEVLHILVREPFDPKQFVKPEGAPRADSIPVLKLNQVLHLPTGLYLWQQMHSSFWRVDTAELL